MHYVCLDKFDDVNVEDVNENTTLRKRNWFITCNFDKNDNKDYMEKIIDDVYRWLSGLKDVNAYCVGFEQGEDEERFHCHIFINYKKNKVNSELQYIYANCVNWKTNISYCKTTSNVIAVIRYVLKQRTKVFGRVAGKDFFIHEGKDRYITSKLNTKLDTNLRDDEEIYHTYEEEIRNERYKNIPGYFVFKNYRKIHDYANCMNVKECKDSLDHTRFIFIFGPSGTGKTSIARDFCKVLGLSYYEKSLSKWWDGYNHEDVVLLNDVNPLFFQKFESELKVWTDRYAMNVEKKGSHMKICPEWFIITSNYSLQELCGNDELNYFYLALWRRAGFGNRINHFDTSYTYLPMEVWVNTDNEARYQEVLTWFMERNNKTYCDAANPILKA